MALKQRVGRARVRASVVACVVFVLVWAGAGGPVHAQEGTGSSGALLTGWLWAIGAGAAVVVTLGVLLARAVVVRRRVERTLLDRDRELGEVRASLERQVTERTAALSERAALLQAASHVSVAVSMVLDPAALMRRVVDVVRDQFDLYYVGLFLLDEEEEWAVLQAGTGEAGERMLARGHKLEVGGASMISWCVLNKRPRVAVDVGEDAMHFDNPDLPETRSEMALPLICQGQVLGALTVQSDRVRAFDDLDVGVVQMMAAQVAVALENARMVTEARSAAERAERVVRRYVQESWEKMVEAEAAVRGYRYGIPRQAQDEALTPGSFDELRTMPSPHGQGEARADAGAWLPAMGNAVRERGAVQVAEGTEASLAVPILSRGVVIGALALRRPAGEPWHEDEVALVEAVSQHVSQALDNRRLFAEVRQRAQQESILRQTSERVRAQPDLDAVLRTAIEEMRRVAGATHVAIRLGTETLAEKVAEQSVERR